MLLPDIETFNPSIVPFTELLQNHKIGWDYPPWIYFKIMAASGDSEETIARLCFRGDEAAGA
jgi:hypothetical protein